MRRRVITTVSVPRRVITTVAPSAESENADVYIIDGKPACLFITENLARPHADGERHFYPAFVKAYEPGYSATDWDYGSDYTSAQKAVDSFNAEHGVKKDAAMLIVTTSMFPAAPILLEDIYRANGEDYTAEASLK